MMSAAPAQGRPNAAGPAAHALAWARTGVKVKPGPFIGARSATSWSGAPARTSKDAREDVIVSARDRPRGDIGHAENCDHTTHAPSGIGWQGGNWLLISRVNLFVPDGIYPVWRPGAGIVPPRPAAYGNALPNCEGPTCRVPGTKGPSIHGLALQGHCRAFIQVRCNNPGIARPESPTSMLRRRAHQTAFRCAGMLFAPITGGKRAGAGLRSAEFTA